MTKKPLRFNKSNKTTHNRLKRQVLEALESQNRKKFKNACKKVIKAIRENKISSSFYKFIYDCFGEVSESGFLWYLKTFNPEIDFDQYEREALLKLAKESPTKILLDEGLILKKDFEFFIDKSGVERLVITEEASKKLSDKAIAYLESHGTFSHSLP